VSYAVPTGSWEMTVAVRLNKKSTVSAGFINFSQLSMPSGLTKKKKRFTGLNINIIQNLRQDVISRIIREWSPLSTWRNNVLV
jgi:hypothetical protein